MKQNSNRSRGRKPKKSAARDGGESVIFREIQVGQRQARVITRVICDHFQISTNGSGIVALQSVVTSGGVTGTPNWASYAGAAIEYRVKGIQIELMPIVPAQTNVTTPSPCYLIIAAYSSFSLPATYGQLLEGPGSQMFNGFQKMKFAASPKGYIDADMWISTSSGVASTEMYGICLAGPPSAPVAAVSQTYFRGVVKYLVQFRSLD
jgi:hypothetical protein